jgi:hypothetical protein
MVGFDINTRNAEGRFHRNLQSISFAETFISQGDGRRSRMALWLGGAPEPRSFIRKLSVSPC